MISIESGFLARLSATNPYVTHWCCGNDIDGVCASACGALATACFSQLLTVLSRRAVLLIIVLVRRLAISLPFLYCQLVCCLPTLVYLAALLVLLALLLLPC